MNHNHSRLFFSPSLLTIAVAAVFSLALTGCSIMPGTPEQIASEAYLEDNYLKVGALKTSHVPMFVKPGRYDLTFVTLNMRGDLETWTGTFDLKAGRSYGRMNNLMDNSSGLPIPELREILTPASAWDIGKYQQFKNLGRFRKLELSAPKP